MANVKIYDDVSVSLTELNAEGPRLLAGPVLPMNLELVIRSNSTTSGDYDFTWPGRSDKVYDLVSSVDLSAAPETWSIWEGNEGISGSGAAISLTDVSGGDEIRRFFAVRERDPVE